MNVRLLRRALGRAAEGRRWLSPAMVHLWVTGDEQVRRLNAEKRGVDLPTDVLSFPLVSWQGEGQVDFVLPPGAPTHLGDIVISFPQAARQAEQYGHSISRELAFLVVHGFLHLLGYDHEPDEDRERMRAMEERALASVGLGRQ